MVIECLIASIDREKSVRQNTEDKLLSRPAQLYLRSTEKKCSCKSNELLHFDSDITTSHSKSR
jgi:hypothetical protein